MSTVTTEPAAAWAAVQALADAADQLAALLATVPDRVHAAAERAPDGRAEFLRMATTSMRRRLDALRVALATDLDDLRDACRPRRRQRRAPGSTAGG